MSEKSHARAFQRSHSRKRSQVSKSSQQKQGKRLQSIKKKYFRRETIVYMALALMFCLIIGRLASIQLVNAAETRTKGARLAAVESSVASPYRGSIVDAQGYLLASSIEGRQVYIDPKYVQQFMTSSRNTGSWTQDTIAESLAQILSIDKTYLLEVLAKDTQYVLVAPHVDLAVAQQVTDLKIDGVVTQKSYRRSYPSQTYSVATLGIVQQDGNGAEGLEYSYNNELLGKNGSGANSLKLTLDSTIQFLIDSEMTKLISEYKPERIAILAMDPKTGRILGNGSYPSFDPNNYSKTDPEKRKDLAVRMTYEPGSVFKIITGSAAVEEAAVSPTDLFDDPGFLRIGPMNITNWDSNVSPRGLVSFAQGMSASSNVVLAQAGLRLGKENFFKYLHSFGFGERTGVDLPFEEIGQLIEEGKAREIEIATMSFGQANLVTPIQLLSAICAVANGGTLYQPYIVDAVLDSKNNVVSQRSPKVLRQILSKETSDIMNKILVDVVDQGTGNRAKIQGIKVAGKTGTAQKINPQTKEYYTDNYIVSFGAYAPADDPKIALLVVVDNPQGKNVQGGQVAAPVAKSILQEALQYMGIAVDQGTPSNLDGFVPSGSPEKPLQIEVKPERPLVSGEACVPNLRGLTMLQAGQELSRRGLKFSFKGSGLAAEQTPAPGRVLNAGDSVEVTFKPYSQ